ncbi:MAG TPA: HDOD domain-containing protein [Burkholderiaceae bacterium]|nr:HDOD domain-containing protein [Burkholderiaceae bacterium]
MPASLIFLELLADRTLRPSALLLGVGPGDPAALLALADHPDLRLLASQIPCFLPAADSANLPPELDQALGAAGCQHLAGGKIVRIDQALGPNVPPGATLIAGHWYITTSPAKPSESQAASRALALQLVQLVAQDADTRDIEEVLRRDATLSYHLLRVVNSLAMGGSRQITSFAQAILLLGRQQLRRWLNLMLFSARAGDERSAMLAARVAVRARSMELLARASGLDRSAQELAFMAGMFSLLGVLFGLPLAQVLAPLKITDALRDAVLRHEGELGRLLQAVEHAERGDAAGLALALAGAQVPVAEYNGLLIEAHNWMLNIAREGGAHG